MEREREREDGLIATGFTRDRFGDSLSLWKRGRVLLYSGRRGKVSEGY